MTWKTIDTIPRDGTMVLTSDGEDCVVGNLPPNCGLGKWKKDERGEWCGSVFVRYYKPTHWTHLPNLPVLSHAPVKKKRKSTDSSLNLFIKDMCECGNPKMGFNCVCDFVKNNPGTIEYSCEYCGLYTASKPRCNRCETEDL